MANIKLNFNNEIKLNGKQDNITCEVTDVMAHELPVSVKTMKNFTQQRMTKMEKLIEVFGGVDGEKGEQGYSAYEIWLQAGNEGTEREYLASLRGVDGRNPLTVSKLAPSNPQIGDLWYQN